MRVFSYCWLASTHSAAQSVRRRSAGINDNWCVSRPVSRTLRARVSRIDPTTDLALSYGRAEGLIPTRLLQESPRRSDRRPGRGASLVQFVRDSCRSLLLFVRRLTGQPSHATFAMQLRALFESLSGLWIRPGRISRSARSIPKEYADELGNLRISQCRLLAGRSDSDHQRVNWAGRSTSCSPSSTASPWECVPL